MCQQQWQNLEKVFYHRRWRWHFAIAKQTATVYGMEAELNKNASFGAAETTPTSETSSEPTNAEGKTPRWLNEQEQEFWRLLLAANRKIDRTIDIALQQANGLTSSEFAVLVTLSEAPSREMRLRDLCAELDWDRSRASHQITRMERRGLVNKFKYEADGRGVIITLTADGMERLKEAAPSHVETVRRLVIDDLNHEDIPVLNRFYRGILADDVLGAGLYSTYFEKK